MKTIFEHINTVKAQPHHIRRQIAFGTAAGITVIIAFVWLAGSLRAGVFAIAGSSFEDRSSAVAADNAGANSGLAGAAAALPSVNPSVPAHIEIVDVASSSSKQKQTEQTTLPF